MHCQTSQPIIHKGDQCLIINATVRNDYTLENPPSNQAAIYHLNGTASDTTATAVVTLTAHAFNQQGQVNATDVTPPYPMGGLRGATEPLDSGENTTLTIYLATSNQDITRFEIIPQFIGTTPPS